MRLRSALLSALIALCAAPALAQLGLPSLSAQLPDPLGTVSRTVDPLLSSTRDLAAQASALAAARIERIERLVRQGRDRIELDAAGDPARRGELLVLGADPAALDLARDAGFALLGTERLDALDLVVTRIAVPAGMPLAKAEPKLRALLPGAEVSADTLHFQAGWGSGESSKAAPTAAPIAVPVGVIDGAPASGASAVRGFASGAPRASDHGSAVISLLSGAGVRRVLVADVYGGDPAGGNALAIARAIDWLAASGARVVSVSLVGPDNVLLARAIAAGQRRGLVFVAAVGNDGPAAPPAYPASYPGVLAVTGVDGRGRPLIEAGRARHLDYAAPGADMVALSASGRWVKVRGTSYAAPLVAARAAAALQAGGAVTARLDREAQDLGPKGPDSRFGRGLLCGACRRSK